MTLLFFVAHFRCTCMIDLTILTESFCDANRNPIRRKESSGGSTMFGGAFAWESNHKRKVTDTQVDNLLVGTNMQQDSLRPVPTYGLVKPEVDKQCFAFEHVRILLHPPCAFP